MSSYSKNLFDVLAEKDNTPVKAQAPVEVTQKTASKEAAKGEKKPNRRPNKEERPTKDGRPRRGRQFDRHSGTGIVDSEKKINKGWGKPGKSEVEGAKDTLNPADPDAPEQEAPVAAEPEEAVKTLDEYLAEKANKSLNVSLPEARKVDDSAFEGAVVHSKEDVGEFFVSNKEAKAKKTTEKSRKEKVVVDIEQRFQEKPRNDFRKNDRRDNKNKGRKSTKSNAANVNLQDAAAFPSLGASA
ncbi:hypothetical protein BY458DRAFT_473382 [Sporodiniella umbellata]|nr:hypothetical protein BY458DRAFT_473382 [Sporodiniella umbellata]